MTTATDLAALPREEQYALVYAGITSVAAVCDGAVQQDGVGFNGQDTKFGKRIASVPFEMWTDDVKEEAARIALTYKAQIQAYLGVDVAELAVVREANGLQTNHTARDDARRFERMHRRQVRIRDIDVVVFDFPFDAALKDELKAAGRVRWNPEDKTWEIARSGLTPELVKVAKANFVDITEEAQEAFDRALAAPTAPAKPKVHGYMLSDQIVFSFPYNPGQKDAIKAAGARWEGSDKTWRVSLSSPKAAAVVAAAREVGLTVATEVDSALGGAQKAAGAELDKRTVLLTASRVSRPNEVSPEFLVLVAQAIK